MPDNYCGPCGVSHSGPVNDKCTIHKRTTWSTATTKAAARTSSKMEMATALVKEERQPVREQGHTDSDDSDEEERKLATQQHALERRKRTAEMSARLRTLTAELAKLSLHTLSLTEPSSSAAEGRRSRDVSSDRVRGGRMVGQSRSREGSRRTQYIA